MVYVFPWFLKSYFVKMFTTICLFLACLILYLWKQRTDVNYWQRRGVPFLKPLPFFGNFIESFFLQKSAGDLMRDLYFKTEDPYFGIWILNKPQLIIKCPDLIKQMLVKNFNHFCDRYVSCDEEVDEFSANMIFFMKNPKWKLFRARTTPMFSACKMKSIFPEMQVIAKNMIAFINASENINSVEVVGLSARYTTQIAYSIAFGVDSKSFQNKDTAFVSLGKNAFTINFLNAIPYMSHYCKSSLVKVFKLRIVDYYIVKFLKEVFFDIAKNRKLANTERGDVLDFLIKFKEESNLGDNEVVAQMAQFLVAGYDTTNTTISLVLYELALNIHIQDKLREEIYTNLDNDGDVSYGSLNTMEYLDKVIHETLRKYPIVPVVGRTCSKDYRIPNTAIVIEKGVEIIVSLDGLHHDPKYYPQPDVFDPERFSDDNIQKRHPFVYMPFGKGPRGCIGDRLGLMLVKLGIVHIIKNFEINICNETSVPLRFDPRKFTLSVVGGVYVQFIKLD